MTIKERLHELVDALSETEADDALRYMVARHEHANLDEWGNLSELHGAAFESTMRQLAREERAAGHGPW